MLKINHLFAKGMVTGTVMLASLGLMGVSTVSNPANNAQAASKNAALKAKVAKMTTNEKLGQLFVASVPNNTAQADYDIKAYHLGGVILYGSNFTGTKTSFKNKLKSYQNSANIPLTISTDQEGGTVSRLSVNPAISGRSYYPSPQAAYKAGGMNGITKWYKLEAKTLKGLGINWDFAPDVDVTSNKNSFIYDRTFGHGYQATGKYAQAAVTAIQSQGVGATLKHFPGYGSAADTHTGSASTNKTLRTFEKDDFVPFRAGIAANVDSVMVTHIILNKIDPKKPASLSKKDISLIADNYNGVIVSDSLQMGAVSNYADSHHVYRDVAAFKAGNDVLLSSNYKQGIPQLKHALAKGQITKSQLNNKVYKILQMKAKLGLIK
ncbi:glycoside hydrolase family 3 protein [Lentilactobacillus kefiri]|uniref:beta-N-acetylhexosaminidase n=1 Tax=Lentilactobacillus kefiri TaxID=33962 RepID=A0A511DX64_LENKE|nr:glycoside hydrolase family 3 N-terminal domain-containing protein [Lentilactobacillus kefiri]KRL65104.1 glycosyl hydrolase family 3 protein [Lentilactobacillus parakefiri DSM 10551]GEL29430.1 beta-N-acetylhexosaminidase [Lentilactobacillus kefiri]